VWHKQDREQGQVPHSSIDTEAHWTKSGWHNWVYGWKLNLVAVVAGVWIPLAAELTAANVADNDMAAALLRELRAEVRCILGDRHYKAPNARTACEAEDRILIASRYRSSSHVDGGVEVRRLFHQLRSRAMENFNEHFKGIFDTHMQCRRKV
jgi:Transposase DDE domain